MTNDPNNLLSALRCDLQAIERLLRYLPRDRCVLIETDPFLEGECLCFPGVMEDCCQANVDAVFFFECLGTEQHMLPDVSFAMIVGRLGNSFANRKFRQKLLEQMKFPEIFQCTIRVWAEKHLLELLKLPRSRKHFHECAMYFECAICFREVLAVDCRAEANSTQHAERIMFDAGGRISNETDEFLFQVFLPLKGIVKFAGDGVKIERIHREVAPLRVLLPCSEQNALGMPSVGS